MESPSNSQRLEVIIFSGLVGNDESQKWGGAGDLCQRWQVADNSCIYGSTSDILEALVGIVVFRLALSKARGRLGLESSYTCLHRGAM